MSWASFRNRRIIDPTESPYQAIEPKACWNCSVIDLRYKLIRRKTSSIFDWLTFGYVDICKRCDYIIDHGMFCADCQQEMLPHIRESPVRFHCSKCKKEFISDII